ncbi:MAG: type III pantothenate kinase [Phycisphaerae bacterium]|jgi:type III pantothenate kinase|nr:type III pantothenate kinase [Phycisphaerae bacterium]MBT5137011.1 type III pantothenate kinase [Phycisphaerae bacterium]MBT6269114.1 type III pantothenate kinase [Phycisphaerae bacterium]MBT6282653.1 type III pantothenate kinase [Phycisphaerae bacterium]
MSTEQPFLALTVGNSRTSIAVIKGDEITKKISFDSTQTSEIVEYSITCWKDIGGENPQIIIGTSNETASATIAEALQDQTSRQIWAIGDDVPAAIGQHLDPETITGIDRLLNAVAAWDTFKEACVVIDAGTCITVDFVDGEGTFHGGAIAPGARMQLEAMHSGTSALPEVSFDAPLREAFGKNTAQAMLQGVFHGIQGMVRQLCEQYALRYGAYPRIIATGGDAKTLFGDDEFIEQIDPDLQMKGIAVSVRHTMAEDDA